MPQIVAEFKKYAIEVNADSVAIFFMSHGFQNLLGMSDGVNINLYLDLVAFFSDEEFPDFIGKPKLFFTHACQSFSDSSSYELSLKEQGFLAKKYSSIFICFPQLAGNRAVRFGKEGTAFIHFICEVFGKYARTMDLNRLINQV